MNSTQAKELSMKNSKIKDIGAETNLRKILCDIQEASMIGLRNVDIDNINDDNQEFIITKMEELGYTIYRVNSNKLKIIW
jgi:hypothetical protein